MTDIETISEMLSRRRIESERTKLTDGAISRQDRDRWVTEIITVTGGYAGFFTELRFSAAGDLVSIEAYE
jgi:hypothetical protein